ncbi:MAG: c-type cytochrome [Terriglobia bacterium]
MRTFKRMLPLLIIAVSLFCVIRSYAAVPKSDAAGLFKSKCSMCHGLDGKGYPAIHTPDFTSSKWQAGQTDARITAAITNGVKGTSMPAWKTKLTTAQIHSLVLYIRSLGQGKGQ